MKLIAPFIVLLLFVDAGSASDADSAANRPIGLTLIDLRAIRKAFHVKQDWLPSLSPTVKALLLDRSEMEVVQIVLQTNGSCRYRGRTERHLLEEQGTASDYAKLAEALQTPYFKAVSDFVELSSSPQAQADLGGYARNLKAWKDSLAQLDATPAEKEGLRVSLGQSLLEMPEEFRNALLADAAAKADLEPLVEKARQEEKSKLAAVKTGEAPPASAADERILAGQLVYVVNQTDGNLLWLKPLTPQPGDDDKRIYKLSLEPGRKVYFKANSEVALALTAAKNPTQFAGILGDKDIDVYFDHGGMEGVSKVDVEALKKQVKRIENKPLNKGARK